MTHARSFLLPKQHLDASKWPSKADMEAAHTHLSAATGYDESQGYAASLRQMAKWVREAVDPRTADIQRITLDDIDAEELDAAAAFIDRMTAVPQPLVMSRDCQCEHPMIKCDHTGCRCTLCGELERLPSQVSRPNEPQAARLSGSMAAQWTYDPEAEAYYFAPMQAAEPPYLMQRHVVAILDIASDGTLAGVELIDRVPPPPTASLSRPVLCPNGLEHGACLHPECVPSCPGRLSLSRPQSKGDQ